MTAMSIQEISEREFERLTREKDHRVIVDFCTHRCGHCKAIGSALQKMAEKFGDRVEMYRIDTDKAFTLTQRMTILSSPTIVFFRDGVEVDRVAGAITSPKLASSLDHLVNARPDSRDLATPADEISRAQPARGPETARIGLA
jgi:thioredoxin-like negative regulator of GroEL